MKSFENERTLPTYLGTHLSARSAWWDFWSVTSASLRVRNSGPQIRPCHAPHVKIHNGSTSLPDVLISEDGFEKLTVGLSITFQVRSGQSTQVVLPHSSTVDRNRKSTRQKCDRDNQFRIRRGSTSSHLRMELPDCVERRSLVHSVKYAYTLLRWIPRMQPTSDRRKP